MPHRKPSPFRLIHASDRSVLVDFGGEISTEFDPRPSWVAAQARAIPGVLAAQPAYTSVLVKFDPSQADPEKISDALEQLGSQPPEAPSAREHVIPVRYDGPDLADVARLTGLSESRVIALHSEANYRVSFLGFMPGFAFLSGLPRELRAPRLSTARLKVPAGSVGIADLQTGVYSLESPGGWRLIGSTPVALLDWKKNPPSLLLPGDSVKFEPVSR